MTTDKTDHHAHHVAKAKQHATGDAHAAVHSEAHAFVADAAPADDTAPATQAEQLAFMTLLGLSGAQVRAALAAKTVTPEQAAQTAKVNVASVARAFTAPVVAALAAGSAISLGDLATPAAVGQAAKDVTVAAGAAALLRLHASSLEYGVRTDADLLDHAARVITKQVHARADVDKTAAATYAPVTAYHAVRYPGSHGHHAPADPPATPPVKTS